VKLVGRNGSRRRRKIDAWPMEMSKHPPSMSLFVVAWSGVGASCLLLFICTARIDEFVFFICMRLCMNITTISVIRFLSLVVCNLNFYRVK